MEVSDVKRETRTVRCVTFTLSQAEVNEVLHQSCQAQVCRKNVRNYVGRNSAVGVATNYRLDGPGIESRWGGNFPDPFRPALGPTQPSIQRLACPFPGG